MLAGLKTVWHTALLELGGMVGTFLAKVKRDGTISALENAQNQVRLQPRQRSGNILCQFVYMLAYSDPSHVYIHVMEALGLFLRDMNINLVYFERRESTTALPKATIAINEGNELECFK